MPDPDDLTGPDPRAPRGGATAINLTGRGPAGNGAAGNGHHGDGHRLPPLPPRPRRPPGPSTKPALVVLGLAVLIFALAFGLELASGSQSRPTPSPSSVATAPRAGTKAVPARPLLSPIVSDGQPPDDLLDALAVPEGTTALSSSAINQGIESYDESLSFEVADSQQAVITFFWAQLPFQHWKVASQGAAPKVAGAYQILAQHPASDGLEWELGVTVDPTVFPSAPPSVPASGSAPGASATGTTHFTFRLFSESDDD